LSVKAVLVRDLCEEGHLDVGFLVDSLYLDSIKSSLTASSVSCLCSGHVFTPTFFKISSFVFNRRKKLI